VDAELTIDDLDARDPHARGLIVLLYFVFVLALEDVELIRGGLCQPDRGLGGLDLAEYW
jgi:hypothetical protein